MMTLNSQRDQDEVHTHGDLQGHKEREGVGWGGGGRGSGGEREQAVTLTLRTIDSETYEER